MQHHIMNPIYDCILFHIWYDTISCTIFCIHNQFQKQHHLYTDALNPGKNNVFKEMHKTSIKINLYQKSLHLIYPYNISSLLLSIYRWYKRIFTRVKPFFFNPYCQRDTVGNKMGNCQLRQTRHKTTTRKYSVKTFTV